MGFDDIFLSFAISYLAGLIPSMKNIFSKRDKKTLHNSYDNALQSWSADDTVRDRIAQQRYSSIEKIQNQFKLPEWENQVAIIQSIAKVWADEIRKDEESSKIVNSLDIEAVVTKIDKLESLLLQRQDVDEPQKIKKGLTKHKPVEGYIRRYCSSDKSENNYLAYVLGNIVRHTLTDYVTGVEETNSNQFILYSSAQTGKTTELKQLCWELQHSELYLPVSFEVRNNTKLKREELPVFQYYGDKEVVVVIDALDEVNGQKYEDLLEEISGYAYDHPDMKIVLSCRSNYRRESQLDKFKELYLEDLSVSDAQDYIYKELGKADGKKLTKLINENRLENFAKNPFFLKVMIDAYKEDSKRIPKTKAEIYQLFVERSYKKEKDKKSLQRNAHTFEEIVLLHERAALGMSLMNAQSLSKEELCHCLQNDASNLEECLRYDLINCEDEERYSFKHNAFREWLVAHYLNREGLEKAKQLATHPNGRIKPEWYNIIMLWVSMYGKDKQKEINDILDWLKGASLDLVIYIDKAMLDENTRNGVFKGLLLEYKSLGIRISNIMTQDYNNLLSFCDLSDDTVSFMSDEVEVAELGTAYYADLMCLCYFLNWELLEKKNGKLAETLFAALEKKTKEALAKKHSYDLSFLYFENKYLARDPYLARIYDIVKDSDHFEAIKSMINLIGTANKVNEYIDYILEKECHVHNQIEGITTHVVSRACIYSTLSGVSSLYGVKKVLTHQFYDINLAYHDEQEGYWSMMNNVMNVVGMYIKEGDPELVELFENYYFRIFKEYHYQFDRNHQSQDFLKKMRDCYQNAGLVEKGRKEFYDAVSELFKPCDEKEVKYETLRSTFTKAALWITVEDVKNDFSCFSPTDVYDAAKASWYREIPYADVAECASQLYKEIYPEPQSISKGRERRKKAFDDFADYSAFKEIVLEMAQGLNEHTSRKDYGKRLRELKDGYNQYAYRFFQHHPKEEESYDIDSIIKHIKDKDVYNAFFMKEISGMTEYPDPDINITKDIMGSCNKIARDIVMKLCDKNYSVFFYREAIRQMLKGGFEIPHDKLVQLLDYGSINISRKDSDGYYTREYSVFEYITERVEEETLSPKVIEKFRENVDNENYQLSYQLSNYIIDNGIDDGYGLALRFALSGFYLSSNVLDSLIENGIKVDEIKAGVASMPVSDRLMCYQSLVRYTDQDDWVKERLESEFKTFEGYNLKRAIQQLLNMGSMVALVYLYEHKEMISDGDDYRFNYDNPNATPILCDFISYHYEHKLNGHFMLTSLLNSLGSIAIRSKDALMEVKKHLNLLTQQGNQYKYLNRYIFAFEDKYYAAYSGITDIREAMDMVDGKESAKSEVDMKEEDSVYISYNWETDSANTVEYMCTVLDLEKIPYKRDKKDCTYLANIKVFMDTIRTGKTVIVVFSRAYLKSKSCMYELSGIMEDTKYFKKILPLVMDDEIRQGEFYLNLVKYWEEEKKKQQEEVDKFKGLDPIYVEPIKEKLDEIIEICKLLPELKKYIDWTNAENLNYMCATKFNSIIRKIRERYEK